MNERPLTLRFFDKNTTAKFAALCSKLGVAYTVVTEENLPDEVTTEPLTSTRRRELISKWANITMERTNESNY